MHLPYPIPICLENLKYDFSITEAIRIKYRFLVCIDSGHLDLQGIDKEEHWKRFKEETSVVHLHGHHQGKDHLSLIQNNSQDNKFWINELLMYHGMVILEIFSLPEIIESLELLLKCIQKRT